MAEELIIAKDVKKRDARSIRIFWKSIYFQNKIVILVHNNTVLINLTQKKFWRCQAMDGNAEITV